MQILQFKANSGQQTTSQQLHESRWLFYELFLVVLSYLVYLLSNVLTLAFWFHWARSTAWCEKKYQACNNYCKRIELNFTTAISSDANSFKLCYVNFRYNFPTPSALGIYVHWYFNEFLLLCIHADCLDKQNKSYYFPHILYTLCFRIMKATDQWAIGLD